MNTPPHETQPGADRVWHPYTRFSALAEGLPEIVRGEGPYLFAADGRRFIDAISSWWAVALGHGHPRMVAAIRRQAEALQHSILGNLAHPPARELAARLASLMPDPAVHVHFASDGASAVEAALKIALQYWSNVGKPGRRVILSLEEAYHGDTLGAVAVGYVEQFHAPFRDLLLRTDRLPAPRSAAEEGAALARAREVFGRHRGGVAALIVEPLCLGAAGMKMYSHRHLRALFDLCREEGALFVADEIATGFGRTGRWFAFQHADGVLPDIVCVGKALSAGYLPISAAIVRDAVYGTFADRPADHTFYHGHTFAGNPIAAAAAVEALRVYEEEGLAGRAARAGGRLMARLEPLRGRPAVRDVRGLGLIAAVELQADTVPRPESRPVRVRRGLLRRGILSRPLGPVVYLMPPLTTPDEVLDALADSLVEAVEEAG